MSDVICLGQFTADVVVTPVETLPEKGKAIFVDSISLHNGGCACNTAVALGKLGIDTGVIGKIGTDTFGNFLSNLMQKNNLDTTGLVREPNALTSSTAVLVSPNGERSFLHYSGANARMTENDVNFNLIKSAKILHVAAAFLLPGLDGKPMAGVLAKAQQMHVTTTLDTAWDAQGRWMKVLEPCLKHVDMFLPSLDEAQMLTGKHDPPDIADAFLTYGVKTVVIKLGADGCFAKTADRELAVAAFEVETVVDTLGAGDAFVAGFLAGMVKGWSLENACRFANATAACCVSAQGASGIKSMEETIKLYPL